MLSVKSENPHTILLFSAECIYSIVECSAANPAGLPLYFKMNYGRKQSQSQLHTFGRFYGICSQYSASVAFENIYWQFWTK